MKECSHYISLHFWNKFKIHYVKYHITHSVLIPSYFCLDMSAEFSLFIMFSLERDTPIIETYYFSEFFPHYIEQEITREYYLANECLYYLKDESLKRRLHNNSFYLEGK